MTAMTVVHFIRPGGLPSVFKMSDYVAVEDTACVVGGRQRQVSMKSEATHDPTLVTCKLCVDEIEKQAEILAGP